MFRLLDAADRRLLTRRGRAKYILVVGQVSDQLAESAHIRRRLERVILLRHLLSRTNQIVFRSFEQGLLSRDQRIGAVGHRQRNENGANSADEESDALNHL